MARQTALQMALLIILHLQITTALPIIQNTAIASNPSTPPELHDKRFFFPETLPDQDELEIALKDTAMREAGFIPSSKREPGLGSDPQNPAKLQKSLPDADAKIGTGASAQKPCNWPTYIEAVTSESPIWPPFWFFVVGAAIVCCSTVLRGIAK